MPRTCILTDSTAHFTKQTYLGHEQVTVIPHFVQFGEQIIKDTHDLGVYKPYRPNDHFGRPLTLAPSVEAFRQTFTELGTRYQEVIAILVSSYLSPAVENARQAAETLKSPVTVHVIDSQTTAAGLGLLVQAAAEAVLRGTSAADINRLVRGLSRHIYAVYCLPDLVYLSRSGQVDLSQAVVGEMLGMIPIFIMENGRFIHIQKIRSPRHLVDVMYEFILEFERLKYLAIVQGVPSFEQESRNLRERIIQNMRTTPLSEHNFSLALATLLGPRSIGLIAMQYPTQEP